MLLGRYITPVLCALMLVGCGGGEDERTLSPREEVVKDVLEKPLPHMALQTLAGEAFTLDAEAITEPTVINVWATWCPPCVKELPDLLKLGQTGNVKVIAITTDRQLDVVNNFLNTNGLRDDALTVYTDPHGKETRSKLKALALPQTYIVSKNGVVKGVEIGEREWAHPAMQEKIENILAH